MHKRSGSKKYHWPVWPSQKLWQFFQKKIINLTNVHACINKQIHEPFWPKWPRQKYFRIWPRQKIKLNAPCS